MIDSSTGISEVLSHPFFAKKAPLILASGSTARQELLRQSRVPFIVQTSDIDEGYFKEEGRRENTDISQVALTLARAKAEAVAKEHGDPAAYIIGADQMLGCEGEWFDKPDSLHAAEEQLLRLRGHTHHLYSAVVLYQGGKIVWTHLARPALTMRSFSDAFLRAYLACEGEALLGCVGAYRLEGLGIQLFSHIEGDHSAILGLPLLPLLAALRDFGVIGG